MGSEEEEVEPEGAEDGVNNEGEPDEVATASSDSEEEVDEEVELEGVEEEVNNAEEGNSTSSDFDDEEEEIEVNEEEEGGDVNEDNEEEEEELDGDDESEDEDDDYEFDEEEEELDGDDESDDGEEDNDDDVNEDNETECSSIVDLACESDDFTTLCSLLSLYSGLVAELSDEDREWTVFAPTDEAFAVLTGEAQDPTATL